MEIKFLINSMDLPWSDTKVGKAKENFLEELADENVVQFRVNVGKKVTFCFLVAISAVRLSYLPGLHILRIYTVKGVDSPCACASQVKLLER